MFWENKIILIYLIHWESSWISAGNILENFLLKACSYSTYILFHRAFFILSNFLPNNRLFSQLGLKRFKDLIPIIIVLCLPLGSFIVALENFGLIPTEQ